MSEIISVIAELSILTFIITSMLAMGMSLTITVMRSRYQHSLFFNLNFFQDFQVFLQIPLADQ